MFLLGVPLLILPFAVYNIMAFLTPGFSLTNEWWHFKFASGGEFGVTGGDVFVIAGILILLIEMMKLGRARRSVMDHLLSMLLLIGMVVEFLMVKEVTSTTFFMLLIISFVDVVGGFAIRGPRRVKASPAPEYDHAHAE
jgi:hypothetical protein